MDKGSSYLNVICLGHVNDAKGQKMSKSKGNVVNPWEVIDQYGADALRWYLFTINQPGDPKNFDIQGVAEVTRKPFILLDNILSFYKLYQKENLKPKTFNLKPSNVLDRWIVARLHQLIKLTTEQLELYHLTEAVRAIGEFINELSVWYVRRSRDRFKSGDQSGINTLGYVLSELTKLMAPFAPFTAEHVYQQISGTKESVHLESWPKVSKKLIDEKLLAEMDLARQIVERGLAARAEAGIKVRQPIASLKIKNPASVKTAAGKQELVDKEEFLELIKDEVNVKEIIFDDKIEKEVELDTALTDELKLEGQAREIIRQINQWRKESKLTVNDRIELYQRGLDQLFDKLGEEIMRVTLTRAVKNEIIDEMKEVAGGRIGIKKI